MKFVTLFQLGLEYENFEFHVEPVTDRILGYDSYKYINEYKILGIDVKRVELVFNLDILVATILEFEKSKLSLEICKHLTDFRKVDNYLYLADSNIDLILKNTLLLEDI